MCRTVHAVLQTGICGIQMLVRVFMTVILMIENVIRMLLQTLYNFISFVLQMISLIPICIVFLLTARLKCFMCGGGGPCPVNRGGTCDCLMSALAFVLLFFIFRATGVLDKIFYSLGYAKARPQAAIRFVPTPGDITECSRNDTESLNMDYDLMSTAEFTLTMTTGAAGEATIETQQEHKRETTTEKYVDEDQMKTTTKKTTTKKTTTKKKTEPSVEDYDTEEDVTTPWAQFTVKKKDKRREFQNMRTSLMYYLI